MNRLNEYLENLDKRNLIMLYLSILILFFIITYYLYQNLLVPKRKKLINKKIEIIKKIRTIKTNNKSVIYLKKQLKNKKIKLNELKEDLNYLKALIFSSDKLNITQKEYLKILDKYIEIGSEINASFNILKTNKLNKYNLKVSGSFSPMEYFVFIKFLKTIQKPNKIITINNLNLSFKNNVFYDMNISIWSFK